MTPIFVRQPLHPIFFQRPVSRSVEPQLEFGSVTMIRSNGLRFSHANERIVSSNFSRTLHFSEHCTSRLGNQLYILRTKLHTRQW